MQRLKVPGLFAENNVKWSRTGTFGRGLDSYVRYWEGTDVQKQESLMFVSNPSCVSNVLTLHVRVYAGTRNLSQP